MGVGVSGACVSGGVAFLDRAAFMLGPGSQVGMGREEGQGAHAAELVWEVRCRWGCRYSPLALSPIQLMAAPTVLHMITIIYDILYIFSNCIVLYYLLCHTGYKRKALHITTKMNYVIMCAICQKCEELHKCEMCVLILARFHTSIFHLKHGWWSLLNTKQVLSW